MSAYLTFVRFAGYVVWPGVDLLEYADYRDKTYRLADVKNDLEAGNMPPGLLLRDDFGNLAMVSGNRRGLVALTGLVGG